jgi:hypothetical protein
MNLTYASRVGALVGTLGYYELVMLVVARVGALVVILSHRIL